MADSMARMFAKMTLENMSHVGALDVELSTLDELEDVEAVFIEHGCTVLRVPNTLKLAVTFPPERH